MSKIYLVAWVQDEQTVPVHAFTNRNDAINCIKTKNFPAALLPEIFPAGIGADYEDWLEIQEIEFN